MKKFWSIFTFTYKETIRNKALIISTIITLIVMLGFFNMDKIVGLFNREGSKDLIMVSTEANNKFFDSNTLESLNDDDFKVVLSKDSEETNMEIVLHGKDIKAIQKTVISTLAEMNLCPVKMELIELSLENLFLEVVK